MSASNGVIRVGRKGIVKFAFGEDGTPFEVDVVVAFQRWVGIDEDMRTEEKTADDGTRYHVIPIAAMPTYHEAAVGFASHLALQEHGKSDGPKSVAEALDFIARLREQYDELADFFQPRKRAKEGSPDTSEAELLFSVEPDHSPSSTS